MGLENVDVAMGQTMSDRGYNNSEKTSGTKELDKKAKGERCDK